MVAGTVAVSVSRRTFSGMTRLSSCSRSKTGPRTRRVPSMSVIAVAAPRSPGPGSLSARSSVLRRQLSLSGWRPTGPPRRQRHCCLPDRRRPSEDHDDSDRVENPQMRPRSRNALTRASSAAGDALHVCYCLVFEGRAEAVATRSSSSSACGSFDLFSAMNCRGFPGRPADARRPGRRTCWRRCASLADDPGDRRVLLKRVVIVDRASGSRPRTTHRSYRRPRRPRRRSQPQGRGGRCAPAATHGEAEEVGLLMAGPRFCITAWTTSRTKVTTRVNCGVPPEATTMCSMPAPCSSGARSVAWARPGPRATGGTTSA